MTNATPLRWRADPWGGGEFYAVSGTLGLAVSEVSLGEWRVEGYRRSTSTAFRLLRTFASIEDAKAAAESYAAGIGAWRVERIDVETWDAGQDRAYRARMFGRPRS